MDPKIHTRMTILVSFICLDYESRTYSFSGSLHNHSHTHLFHAKSHKHGCHPGSNPSEFDMDKLRSTLKQFVRDWSEEVLDICVLLSKDLFNRLLAGHYRTRSVLQAHERCLA